MVVSRERGGHMACGSSIESMYRGVVSKVRFSHEYRAKFSEQVGVYKGSDVSTLLIHHCPPDQDRRI